ncbi:ROK family protein [Curtobacterium sp. Leaf261]|uniref:ROK family protein n=1 Tax=Curtobacterium sp. Leaf261 TaxID=1736311 RepID=UPI0006FB2631|nr:ROK family protein [Curtobacterium sp. Leaf261]KQO64404.1 hypothetical protein ASF23_16465 [Curtobacterium sp. Leaf261]
MSGPAVVGIDVGGTSIKARLVDRDGIVLAEHRAPTPRIDPAASELAATVVDLVVRASADAAEAGMALAAVGVVVPGVVDDRAGVVVLAVNLGWRDVPVLAVITSALEDAGFALPVAFGQDVRAGALAEARSGAASARSGTVSALSGPASVLSGVSGAAPDHDDAMSDRSFVGTVAFVPVGTGLASALVADGVLVGAGAWSGEIGQVVIPSGPHRGSRVEEIASAGAVAQRAGEQDARSVADRVRAGDADARRVWDDCVDVLADALAWITAVSGCTTIVVGGGLAEADDLLLAPLRGALSARLAGVRVPSVVRATHGDAAGAIGAAFMAADLLPAGATA